MNTQDIHAFMPRDYLTNCLKSDGEHLLEGFQSDSQDGEHGNEALKSDSQPANYDPISLLPPDAFLAVNPPNIPVLDFFRGAEAALLHVDPNTYRDLTYIKQRYVFFKAANGVGNVPKMSVNCKKGTCIVAIIINSWKLFGSRVCKFQEVQMLSKSQNKCWKSDYHLALLTMLIISALRHG